MSSSAMPNDITTSDLEAVLKLLPACRRCRKNKKRCDLLLPACFNCSRAEEECLFLDHITNDLLPRTYIASLVGHIKDLEAKDNVATAHLVPAKNITRYLGGRAALAIHSDALFTRIHQDFNTGWQPPVNFSNGWSVNPEMHTFLVDRYFHTIHKAFPVFDWPSEFLSATSPADVSNSFLYYIRPMVYSIACHCLPGNDPRFVLLSGELYRQAVASAEDIMSRVSVEALQAVLLLALRCLFDPHEGSLGQQIAFAKSLMKELASRGLFENTLLELPLRRTLYCLDNLVGSVLDRPSELPGMDVPQTTDLSNQTAFLALQYQEQWRYRNNYPLIRPDTCVSDCSSNRSWSSLTCTAQRETRFLVDASASSALDLLHEYCHPDTVFTIFTAHWTLKAALRLLRGEDVQNTWYPLALRILERCSLKWPETGALRDSLFSMSLSKPSMG